MYPFRNLTPNHSAERATCVHYSSYRQTLRDDFSKRCGYCNSLDRIRIRSYAIDHFIPQNPEGFTHNVLPNDYYNLIYACNYCNTYKSNKWPTLNPNEPNNGVVGFIKPTTTEYTEIFKRSKEGRIQPNDDSNLVAKYMINELKLWLPIHELMWKLEKLKSLEEQVKIAKEKTSNEEIKSELHEIHFDLLLMINEIQESIFDENE